MKQICPLSKKELPICCETCKFAVMRNEQTTGEPYLGCTIKHIARNLFANKEIGKELLDQINSFRESMSRYG